MLRAAAARAGARLLPAGLLLLAWSLGTDAGAAETAHPLLDHPGDALAAQPPWMGVVSIAMGLFPLLMGWVLIRWSTALVTAGAVAAAVLFTLQGHLAPGWLWTVVGCCAALAGVLGWFLYPALFALQMATIAGGLAYGALTRAFPGLPVMALGALVAAIAAAVVGLRLAPWAAIAQTVITGYGGILAGMLILCRPASAGEQALLAILTALITIPLGAWVQARALRRERSQP